MIYCDKRDAARPGEGFGKVEAHKEGAEEAWMGGCGGTFYIGGCEAGLADGFFRDTINPLGVHTAGDFRNYSLPGGMEGDLACDYIGKNNAAADNSGGTFITGCFYAQDYHALLLTPAKERSDSTEYQPPLDYPGVHFCKERREAGRPRMADKDCCSVLFCPFAACFQGGQH